MSEGKVNTPNEGKLGMTSIQENIDKTIVNEIYPPITKLDSMDLYFPSSSPG